jgi:hypothetical protein
MSSGNSGPSKTGRYFNPNDAAASLSDLQTNQQNEGSWLALTLNQLGGQWNAPAQSDSVRDQALSILARGLESNSGSKALWLLYIELYMLRTNRPKPVDSMLKIALRFNPYSITFWSKLVEASTEHQTQVDACHHALVALSRSTPGCDETARVKLLCDMLTRLLHAHCCSGKVRNAAEVLDFVLSDEQACAARLLPDSMDVVAVRTHRQYFALCLAHLLVYDSLPYAAIVSLGAEKSAFALTWQRAAPFCMPVWLAHVPGLGAA